MLEQCCNHLKQCNNVATLYCAKNRRLEWSLLTSPLAEVQCLCEMGGKKKEKGKKAGVKPSLKIVIKEHKLLTIKYDDL